MTRAHRNVNIGAVILPFVAFLAAIPLLWNQLVGWTDLAIFAGIYLATALGVTVGFHRMLTHRSFETYRPVKYALAIPGSMAVQGDVIAWVSDHRKHHAYTDEEGDPHRPRFGASTTRTSAGCSSTTPEPRPSVSPRTCSRTGECA